MTTMKTMEKKIYSKPVTEVINLEMTKGILFGSDEDAIPDWDDIFA